MVKRLRAYHYTNNAYTQVLTLSSILYGDPCEIRTQHLQLEGLPT